MKITQENKTGIGTAGATGIVLMIAVIWSQISPWWLLMAVSLILSGIGSESDKRST